MGRPTVSVIMNCLNGERYLREAVDSVFAQTYRDWEIIFWDNASTDASAAIAKSYGERVRYFRSEETHPLGKARNLAMQQSRGEYLAFLDCDDIWLPQKLERQIPLFEKDSKVGLVFSDAIYFGQQGRSWKLYRRGYPPRGCVFRDLLNHYFLSMGTVVIRRSALLGLDEWFDDNLTMVEEVDLFLRLAYQWDVDYIAEPLSKYRIHSESLTHTRPELLTIETEMVLSKFRRKIDRFEAEFKREIEAIRRDNDYQEAQAAWENGGLDRSRTLLKKHFGRDPKAILLYALTYLPHTVFEVIKRRYQSGW